MGFCVIDGRRGYFLVVTLPDGEMEGGFESRVLTPENADREAAHLRGAKAIFWHFVDEQGTRRRDGGEWWLKPPVRHLVAPVPEAEYVPQEPRPVLSDEWEHRAGTDISDTARRRRLLWVERELQGMNIKGTWSLCEKYLKERGGTIEA